MGRREKGPRIERRGKYWSCDLRTYGGSRYTVLRDPSHARWPSAGERTEFEEVAERWKWAYVDAARDSTRRRQLGQKPAPRPLAALAEDYFAEKERTSERATVMGHRTAIETHLIAFAGARTSIDEACDVLPDFAQHLLRAGYERATVKRYLGQVGVFVRWAGYDMPKVDLGREAVRDVRAFSDEEVDMLFDACVDEHERYAVALGVYCGLRQGEILAARWEHFRPRERTLRVSAQVDYAGVLRLPKGKRAGTSLVLPQWWDMKQHARGFVVARADGAHWDRNMLYGRICYDDGSLYARAGLREPDVGLHALRHTYARMFLEGGGSLLELKKSLRHSSIQTTERYYEHFAEDAAAASARRRIYKEEPLRRVK